MAASTAIMHAASTSGGNNGGVLGSSSSGVVPATSATSASSSSSDEEEVVLRVEEEEEEEEIEAEQNPSPPATETTNTQIPTESSDTHSEKVDEEDTTENCAPVAEEDNIEEDLKEENPSALPVAVPESSASPKTAEVSEDSASTIVGDDEDEDENSQQSIEVDDDRECSDANKKSLSEKDESDEEVEVDVDNKEQCASSPPSTVAASPPESGLFASAKTASNGPKKALATGKLERITAALAAKNHHQSSGDRQLNESSSSVPAFPISSSAAALMLTQFGQQASAANSTNHLPPETSTTATTISEDEESGMIEDDDDDDDLDDEEEDEEGLMMDENGQLMIMTGDEDEDDEEIKNGFRALGLMGNVAFMGEEKFKCPVCGLKLDSQHTFTLHIRSHNPNDHSNTCRLCGKTLSSASSLDRHMLIHSGERPFKCSICNMAFTTNGNMHRHMRTHGHGTIGYTPRGAKRRAKLFAQQAAKVAAAAAAGEPVDAATISKLKKSALEVTTGNGKSPISGTPMKKQRGSGGRKSAGNSGMDSFGSGNVSSDEGIIGVGGSSDGGAASAATLAEAEQIAAAAAAYAASVAATNHSSSNHHSSGDHHHSKKKRDSHHHHRASSASPFAFHGGSSAAPSLPHQLQHPSSLSSRLPTSSSSPSNHLNPLSGWPSSTDLGLLGQAAGNSHHHLNNSLNFNHLNHHHQNSLNQSNAPLILPQKGKPGRKRKIRPEEATLMMNGNGLQGSPNSTNNSSFPANAFSNLTGPSPCPICAGRLNSKMELHLHMTSFHAAEKLFCLDCGMILDNYSVYTQHHCTVTAAAVMQALAANPQANPELLFRSTNTSRMNFSSARFGGAGAGQNSSGNSGSQQMNQSNLAGSHHSQQQQDHISSMLSQLSKSPFFSSQHQNPNQRGSLSSTSHSSALQPIVDLSAKSKSSSSNGGSLLQPSLPLPPQTVSAHQAAHHFSGGPACNQCGRKFANTKLLKTHFDTFCHECAADCGSQTGLMSHQIQHSIEKFPNLSKALGNGGTGSGKSCSSDAGNGFNMAAALPGLLGMQAAAAAVAAGGNAANPLIGSALTSTSNCNRNGGSPSPFNKRHSYPKHPPVSTSLDLTVSTTNSNSNVGSSLASLTSTMADMKPDLADIQSILSMAKHAKLPLNSSTGASQSSQFGKSSSAGLATNLPLSLSPNRASDAGVDAKKASARSGGGQEAGSHPDSPASADSAAAAVAAAHGSSSAHHHSSQLAISSLTSGHQHHHKNGHESAKGASGGEDENGNQQQTSMATPLEVDDYVEAEEEDDDGDEAEDEDEEGLMIGEEEEEDEEEQEMMDEENKESSPAKSNKKRRRSSANADHQTPTKKSRQENHHQQDQHSPSSTTSSTAGTAFDPNDTSSNSGLQRFRCEQCRLSFKSMNAFRRHNRGHTAGGGHSHACHLCPYKSLDKSTLIRHLRTHNGERPFQCAICKYAFTTKANCERHVRKRHRNLKSKVEIRAAMQYNRDMAATAAATRMVSEKIFIERDELPTSQDTVCKQCSVDFGNNRALRAHLRVPNNPCSQQLKPFVCTICKIGFNTRNNCVRHIIKQHPATIECEDGDEEAATKLISAVTSATGALGGEPMTAEALIANMGGLDKGVNGSNSSLSPGGRSSVSASGGKRSGKSGRSKNGGSDRGEPYSDGDHDSDECESFFGTNGSFDEEGSSPKKPLSLFTQNGAGSGSSPLVSPASNASFAALCQVAAVEQQKVEKSCVAGGSGSPALKRESSPPVLPKANSFSAALNLSVKSDDEEETEVGESREDVLDLSAKPTAAAPKHKKMDKGGSLLNGSLDLSLKPTTSSSKLLNGNAGLLSSSGLSKSPMDYHHQFSGFHHQQIPPPPSNPITSRAAPVVSSNGGYPLEIASLMRGAAAAGNQHLPNSTTASLLSFYKQQTELAAFAQQQQQQQQAAIAAAAAAAAAHFDMNAMAATFAKYGQQQAASLAGLPNSGSSIGGISNETLASLMAQFHQQNQAFAAMKAPMAKNH